MSSVIRQLRSPKTAMHVSSSLEESITLSFIKTRSAEGPPKQVDLIVERLDQAACLIDDFCLGADRFLEAVLSTTDLCYPDSDKTLIIITKDDASIRQHSQDLCSLALKEDLMKSLDKAVKSLDEDNWKFASPRSQIHLVSQPESHINPLPSYFSFTIERAKLISAIC